MNARSTLNRLRIGAIYRATAGRRLVIGEYLGIETPYGERSILLRNASGTDSIALGDVTSIHQVAA